MFDVLIELVSNYPEAFPLTELSVVVYGPSPHLEKLLSLSPNLKVFKYTHLWATGEHLFDLRYLFETLLPIKNQVRDLTIAGKYDPHDGPLPRSGHNLQRRFGTLRNFQQLTKLEIPWVLLTELCAYTSSGLKDLLPPNLEILTVNDFLAPTIPNYSTAETSRDLRFILFLEDWRQHTPRLRRIIWKGTFDYWSEESVGFISRLYTADGITWQL
jgi:hypothetical protein